MTEMVHLGAGVMEVAITKIFRVKKMISVGGLLFFLACNCFGQKVNFLPITKLESGNGLSSPNVEKIFQDKNKFMWFATIDGLVRFDGLNYISFNSANKNPQREILGRDVRDMKEGIADDLWVVTAYGGLNQIDINTCSVKQKVLINDSAGNTLFLKCLSLQKSNIFIGTEQGIAIKFNTVKSQIENEFDATKEVNSDVHISDVFVDSSDRVWLFLSGYGILITDTLFHKIKLIPVTELFSGVTLNLQFNGHILYHNKLFLATSKGVKIVSIGDFSLLQPEQISPGFADIMNTEWTSIFEENGEILFCNENGLGSINLNNNSVQKIFGNANYEDKEWFAWSTCLYKTDQSIWANGKGIASIKNISAPFNVFYNSMDGSGLKLGTCWGLYSLDDSTILAGGGDDLYKINHLTGVIKKYNINDYVTIAFKDINNNILISGINNGLKVLNKNGKLVNLRDVYPELISEKNYFWTTYQKFGDSLLFIGTVQNGMFIWNMKRKTIEVKNTFSKVAPLKNNSVKALYLDSKNKLWILCDNAISLYDPVSRELQNLDLKKPEGDEPLSINMDVCEWKDHYWIACYGTGIVELDRNHQIENVFTEKDGLANASLYKIFPLNDSCVIASSNNGLCILNIYSKKVKNYFKEDGLQSNNFDQLSGCKNGNFIFFGGVNGITKIDITKLKNNPTPPILYFTDVKTETKDGLADSSNLAMKEFKIPSSWLQTNISFVGLSYVNPEGVTYSYRIKENDTNWINLGKQNFVTLIGLSPGTYTLEVRSANEDGVWSEPKTLSLTFLPKWYQTAWFKAAIILAVGGLFYGFYRYRINQLKKQQQIRRDIASDLHDDLGATLNSVRIFTSLAETSPKREDYFQQIKESVNVAYSGLRDMIWVLDDTGDTVADLVKRIKQFAEPLAHANNMQLHFVADGMNEIVLNKTEKRNLLLIAKEAINNCMKYAACRNIQIKFSRTDGKLAMMMLDDGLGFDETEITPGNGLKNIRARAKQIHYTASIKSEKGEGTTITVVKK